MRPVFVPVPVPVPAAAPGEDPPPPALVRLTTSPATRPLDATLPHIPQRCAHTGMGGLRVSLSLCRLLSLPWATVHSNSTIMSRVKMA